MKKCILLSVLSVSFAVSAAPNKQQMISLASLINSGRHISSTEVKKWTSRYKMDCSEDSTGYTSCHAYDQNDEDSGSWPYLILVLNKINHILSYMTLTNDNVQLKITNKNYQPECKKNVAGIETVCFLPPASAAKRKTILKKYTQLLRSAN